MFNKFIWPTMMVVSVFMVTVFIFGFAKVVSITDTDEVATVQSDVTQSETTNEDTSQNSQVDSDSGSEERVILIIGDSIGAGVGDERNLGIGERFVSRQDYEVTELYEVVNFSSPGAVTNNLLEQVIGGEIDEAIKASDLIIISIGGNNLNRLRSSEAIMQIVEFEETLANHIRDLRIALEAIREKNNTAELVVLGLYNPYGDGVNNEDIRMLQEWNYQTRMAVFEVDNSSIIPLYDLFENNLDQFLSIDAFHPSGDGYERIAEMMDEVIESKE